MPACRNTPADAAASSSQTTSRCPSSAACATIDLLTKPDVSGNDEIESAPIVPQIIVSGIVRNRPPRSVHLRRPGLVQHGAGRHQQQRLVEDVGERMRGGAVQRHLRADADADQHEADLVHDAVGEDAPHVVFEQRVHDAVEDHEQPDEHQQLGAGKAAQQHVHRRLRRERRQEDRAAPRRLRIGVGQPGGERRRAGVDEEAREDQPVRRRVERNAVERRRAGRGDVPDDAGHQHDAAEQMDHRVAHAGPVRRRRSGAPDDQRRADRHQLPEHEHGEQVAGQRDADRRARIDEGGRQPRCGSPASARTGRRRTPSPRRPARTGATACRPRTA